MAKSVSYSEQAFSVCKAHTQWDGVDSPPRDVHFRSRCYARSKPESRYGVKFPDGDIAPTDWYNISRGAESPLWEGFLSPVWDPSYRFFVDSPGVYDAQITLPPDIYPPDDKLRDQAVTQVMLNLLDKKVDLGVALAEAKQTAEFLGSSVNRIAKGLDAAYQRNPREWLRGVREAGKKGWKNIPQYYLEHCYALTPLLSDIDGSMQALSDSVVNGLQPLVKARGRAQSETFLETFDTGSLTTIRTDWVNTHKVEVGITCDVPGWVLHEFDKLGLTNPALIAWEKVPYSFVVDRIIPIGDWISTWDVSNYLQFRHGYVTRVTDSKGKSTIVPTQNTAVWGMYEVSPGQAWFHSMQRQFISHFPSVSFPSLRNPLSLDFVAKSLALLTQVVSGHKRLASLRV